jgi:hypothetical protein
MYDTLLLSVSLIIIISPVYIFYILQINVRVLS